jgi:hypothetical protein
MFLKKGLVQTTEGKASTTEQPNLPGIDPGLRQAITEQIESRNATNIQADKSKPAVYEVKYNGKIYTIEMVVLGQPRIMKTEG